MSGLHVRREPNGYLSGSVSLGCDPSPNKLCYMSLPTALLNLSDANSLFPSPNIFSSRPPTTSSLPRSMSIPAAITESKGASLGFRPPDFQLPEPLSREVWKLDDYEPYPSLLVMSICNHCPFVKHLEHDIVKLTNFYAKDGPEFMAEEAKYFNYPFPYLYDESSSSSKRGWKKTFELFYHGQFDDSWSRKNIPVTGRDLSLAIDAVLSGQALTSPRKPSVGCSIKWHPETNQ